MSEQQLLEILAKGESQEAEFKESFHSNQELSKTICSLANTEGGVVIIGARTDGSIVGVTDDLDVLQQKVSAANQAVSPVPLASVEPHRINDKGIVVIVVQRSTDNVYYTFQGAIHVRQGSTNRRLDGQTHLEFLRNRQILSFDETFDSSVTLEDIDRGKVEAYLREREQGSYLKEHTLQDFLVSRRLAVVADVFRVKNAAILMFGKDPTQFFPQAEIQLVQFSGLEAVDIISNQTIRDDVSGLIERAMAFVQARIGKRLLIDGPKRKEQPEYPLPAIREAIVNAVTHRDYFSRDAIQISLFSDRVEITNPGSIPQALPRELFGTISVRRNPLTYLFLRDMGYVEGLGTGIPRMKNEMRKAGLSDPEFHFTESFFRVVFRNQPGRRSPVESAEQLNDRQKNCLAYLEKNGRINSKTYSQINDVSVGTAINDINEMMEFGYLKKIGKYRGAHYVLA